jgi:pantoate--beta-alanine ligase
MIIFKIASELESWLETGRAAGKIIGFVPTMGALHEGHISLIDASKKQADLTVSSIFINPTQFNNAADFEKYPVSLEDDVYLLAKAGCDAVFVPSVNEIYPAGVESPEHFELGFLETILEGKFRPGHFQGVCLVVKRLLEITNPNVIFLGQKDYQQCMVIKKLTSIMGSNTVVHICETRREKDGLAMSSRNRRLTKQQRAIAPAIYKNLLFLKSHAESGKIPEIKTAAAEALTRAGFKVDYVEIATAQDLKPVNSFKKEEAYVALIAAYVDDIRLIDNMLI